MSDLAATFTTILAGALGGAAIGVERQWSGHATGPDARFGGVRTFTLLGGVAALAGALSLDGRQAVAAVVLGGATALVIVGYAIASRHDVEATTEAAALVVLAAGFVAGLGHLALESGIIAVTSLILIEKSRLHALVARLDDTELRAAARFAVMAIVVLPLLPEGPYGPFGGVRPRQVWMLVLLFSGLSFAGYIARRIVGARQGYVVAGLLGGLISSTSVAITFARLSREDGADAAPLAVGAVASSTVMVPRMLLAAAVLSPVVAVALLPFLLPGLVVGVLVVVIGMRRGGGIARTVEAPTNPLQFVAALQMAVVFQAALLGVNAIHAQFGEIGVRLTGAVLGLTDVDALVIAMARNTANGLSVAMAAQAIAIGGLSNTLFKMGATAILGSNAYRRVALASLGAISVALAAALWVLR
ncbi:MAG: DUF4010 domain-containing protein [Ardenticatenales bacterium]